MVKLQPSKLMLWVRFPSLAPIKNRIMEEYPSLAEGIGLENRQECKSSRGFESLFLRIDLHKQICINLKLRSKNPRIFLYRNKVYGYPIENKFSLNRSISTVSRVGCYPENRTETSRDGSLQRSG
jgi:hypothetical protein